MVLSLGPCWFCGMTVSQKYRKTAMNVSFNFALWTKRVFYLFFFVLNCICFLTIHFKFLLTDVVSMMKYSIDSILTWIRWEGTVMMQADKDFLRRPRRTYRNLVRLWISSGVSLLQMSSPHNKEPMLWIPIRKIFFCFFYWKDKQKETCYFLNIKRKASHTM